MENYLMKFYRETNRFTVNPIADHLRIDVKEYNEIESGKRLITHYQAAQLGKLYRVKGNYFYSAALQLELLYSRNELIKAQKEKIEELRGQLDKLSKAA